MLNTNKRIAKNTAFLYFRMFITMLIGLYTSRIVLQVLGISDYGLYNVVGGTVTLFAFINGTLATGTQRFLSFELGRNDAKQLKIVFSTAVLLHSILALLVVVLAETIGLWFLYNEMNIAADRMFAAFWTFQFSVFATSISIIQVPFMASIICHEKMKIYACMSVYDVTMKLAIVVLIGFIDYDKLILYGALVLLVNLIGQIIYNVYCRNKYEECKFNFTYDRKVFKEIATFSGWNILGCTAVMLQMYGVNILLNIFHGTVVNSARGIAFQVSGSIMQFVNNFQIAVNPQIIKMYASGQIKQMTDLVLSNSKLAAFLLLFITIPVFIEIEYVLHFWLGTYPDYTPIFIRIILIQSVFQTISKPIVMVAHASGRLKMINLTAGSMLILSFPVSYLFLKMGCSPVTIFIINAIPWPVETLLLLYWMNKYIGFSIVEFYKQVYARIVPLAIMMYLVPYSIGFLIPDSGFLRLFVVLLSSLSFSSFVIYFWGIDASMRSFIRNKIKNII